MGGRCQAQARNAVDSIPAGVDARRASRHAALLSHFGGGRFLADAPTHGRLTIYAELGGRHQQRDQKTGAARLFACAGRRHHRSAQRTRCFQPAYQGRPRRNSKPRLYKFMFTAMAAQTALIVALIEIRSRACRASPADELARRPRRRVSQPFCAGHGANQAHGTSA